MKRAGAFHGFRYDDSPLDVVGWDGALYPFAFPILNFQPRAGLVHLPPTWHGTFAARGALVCSFVPRLLDFHPEAVPCPTRTPRSTWTNPLLRARRVHLPSGRRGRLISHHPAGMTHGPHPGAYEASIGATDDRRAGGDARLPPAAPATPYALGIEDPGYQESFIG